MNISADTRRSGLVCLILAFATALIYWPVHRHEFINYDDPYYVTGNTHVKPGITGSGVVWAFTRLTGEPTYWHPVTWLSHMLDCQLFGVNAGAHHLMSVFFHVLNVALLFCVLKSMTGSFWRSAIVAAMFAWHPIQVDTVAWVAERKNLLSTLFWLLLLWAYACYAREKTTRRRRAFYILALLFFALGLMCKPMLITAPFTLLLMDYWPLQRFPRPAAPVGSDGQKSFVQTLPLVGRLLAEKVPFFLAAIVSSVITFISHGPGTIAPLTDVNWFSRLSNVVVCYALYIGKFLYPVNLAVYYPHVSHWPNEWVLISIAFLVVVTGLVCWLRNTQPALMVGWFWFLGTLVPVIGIVQVGAQSIADRFAYVPIIGFLIVVVWGGAAVVEHCRLKLVGRCLPCALLVAVAICSSVQVRYWQNSVTLFEHALAVTKENALAHFNLGGALGPAGRVGEAIPHFLEAIRIRPTYKDPYHNLGVVFESAGNLDKAAEYYGAVVKLDPNDAQERCTLASVLMQQGKLDEALGQCQEALKIKPDSAEAHYCLGNLLYVQKRLAESYAHFLKALELQPDFDEARQNLALVRAELERMQK